MTALLAGELKVELLRVVGSDQLAVRPLHFSHHYQRLQEKLQREGHELKILSLPSVNQSCAVLSENRWRRGLVEATEEQTCRVRLVDLGRIENVCLENLRELPEHFLQEHAYCILCHLPGCSDADGNMLEIELGDQKMVTLHRRGVPEMKCGAWSLPVEICWEKEIHCDPVGLPVKRTVFLSQQMIHKMRVQAETTLDTTKSEET